MSGIMVPAIVVAVVAGVLALVLMPMLSHFSRRWNLLDYPDARKLHGRPVPLVGGIAIVIAAFVALGVDTLWEGHLEGYSWWFALAAVLLLAAGTLDDLVKLRYWGKASLQIAAILLLIFLADATVTHLGALSGGTPVQLGYAAIPFTLVCLLGYVNAANMIDGLDGLAGGVVVIALGFLAAWAWIGSLPGLFLAGLAFASATLAFLVFNLRTPWRKSAVVFLGDAGSMALGLAVGWIAVRIAGESSRGIVTPMCLAWILALPVMDTLAVMVRRLVLRRNPFKPDRLHLHYVLVEIGCPPGRATALLLGLSFLYGCYGLAGGLAGLPQWVLFVSFLGVFVVHALFVTVAHRRHVVSDSLRTASPDSLVS